MFRTPAAAAGGDGLLVYWDLSSGFNEELILPEGGEY